MIRASIYGRLGSDPVVRSTRTGKRMTTANVAVNAARDGDDAITEWFGVVGFGRAGEELARCRKGDLLSAMGPLTRSQFTGRDGQERIAWSLTAEAVVSARTVRPGGAAQRASALFKRRSGEQASTPMHEDSVSDLYADGTAA